MQINELENFVKTVLPKVGVNKLRELTRLVYEIAKRENLPPQQILIPSKNDTFESVKTALLKRRYPVNFKTANKKQFYLPKLESDEKLRADLTPRPFYPKTVFIETSVKNSPLAARVRAAFPNAEFKDTDGKTQVGSADFSRRTETLLIHQEKYDFLKPCPCSCGSAGCGYNLINLGFGCRFECEYCFLQQYQNLHAILWPANVDEFLQKLDGGNFNKGPFDRPRIGSGEFTDSLVFDDITQYSQALVPFFRARAQWQFEFKTKSVNIGGLLKVGGCENVVVSWSVNSSKITDEAEHFTPGLTARLQAACEVARAGYRIGFHFDPVVIYDGYEPDYARTIQEMADTLPADKIAWISVGTLRFSRELKKQIEMRFPNNFMLDGEFLLDFDGKMRYGDSQRIAAYQFLVPLLRKTFPKAHVYLCMEDPQVAKMFN
ncbi:SPL family radical SAM protein [Candidatus Avelusimicrobium caledoniensis]|uniref:SPL family radical SAM protein n=1 Tax=Candidatus Avelusimicrobium caledoniensis TaxID=3416220 RepID=UPI003D137061